MTYWFFLAAFNFMGKGILFRVFSNQLRFWTHQVQFEKQNNADIKIWKLFVQFDTYQYVIRTNNFFTNIDNK